MDFYLSKNQDDPDWLSSAAVFHGHLGPWLVTGAMIGHDAIGRLDTPGRWKIDVTCWMPADKQRTPYSCILDGLQISSGATLGKQNIRFACSPDMPPTDVWPIVHVVRLKDNTRPREGLAYHATEFFHEWLKRVTPERLEECSRELARESIERLFDIRPLTNE